MSAESGGGESRGYVEGDLIDRKYRLTRVIGEGGMGAVWLARNQSLDVDVAIKLIRREVARPETARRLMQEARAAARLKHASIVRVFDFGETDRGDPFIVMEVLMGDSLRDLLSRVARLPATTAVRTLLPVASALAAAHSQGIVHRDLKPDNIVLVTDETGAVIPKVVDFGIAKLRGDEVDGKITVAGTLMGSPDYMSPEQARGRDEIDERTDIWALSVVLYESITGKPPFSGANYNALLSAITTDEPIPTTEHAAGDADLWSIVSHGLAKGRDARWPTMRDFGGALAEWALAQGHDTDVAGGSLVVHWLGGSDPRALPDLPRMSRPSLSTPDTLAPPAPSTEPPVKRAVRGDETPPPRVTSLADDGEVAARRPATAWLPRVGWAGAVVVSALALWLAFRSRHPADVVHPAQASNATTTATSMSSAAGPPPPAATATPAASTTLSAPAAAASSPTLPTPPRPTPRTSVPVVKPGKPKGLQIPDAPNF